MKYIKLVFILIIILSSYQSKAQNLQLTESSEALILGTWIDDDDPTYKLVFFSNAICKEYQNNELIATYEYDVKYNSCEDFMATSVVYLYWRDLENQQQVCFEISNITNEVLSLMIIDRAKMVLFNKV